MSAPALDAITILDARQEAVAQGRDWMECLVARSKLEPDAVLRAIAQLLDIEAYPMAALHAATPAFDQLAFAEAAAQDCLPLERAGRLHIVIADPFDARLQSWLDSHLNVAFDLGLALREDIRAYLARQEGNQKAMDHVLAGEEASVHGSDAEDLSLRAIGSDGSPVVRLVHSTLHDALQAGVSDIHLENDGHGILIRYRIDGVLGNVGRVAGVELAEQVISRIKVMAELDISERRVPQDGRFKARHQGREVDFRISIMPSVFGEDAVLRILDRRQLADELAGLTLEQLGFAQDSIARMRRLCLEPYGMVLVTGPTGSGKTTTLYAAISEINHGRDKIVTIEDPVEYQLSGVLQIPVNEKKGLTFARGLRSILRHDPDKIMVGEIRDPETAQIAVQSALTGHLVLTTVHANNVFDVIGRFMHMGVDPYSLVSALNGIVAQRLVRVNCAHCAVPVALDEALILESGLQPEDFAGAELMAGQGCGHCRGSGFRGRHAVAEILQLNDELRELIVARAPIRQIKAAAYANGTRSLRDAALDMVRLGHSTLEEVNRVTFVA